MKKTCWIAIAFLALMFTAAMAENDCPQNCVYCRGAWDCSCCNRCSAHASKTCGTAEPKPASTPRPSSPDGQSSSPSRGDYTTLSSTAQEQKLLNLLNEDRTRNGLPALAMDSELSALARTKSQDMLENGYFAHESPTLGSAAAMLDGSGYAYQGVGENIAHHANVEKANAAFLSSPAHRTVMMGSQWEKVGVGVAEDEYGFVYVTELFVR